MYFTIVFKILISLLGVRKLAECKFNEMQLMNIKESSKNPKLLVCGTHNTSEIFKCVDKLNGYLK